MIRKKIKLLIVDDSKMFRDMLSMALKDNPNMEVIGTAEDAFDAKDKVGELHPDVIIIDFEMPKMDGVTFIKQLMQQYPIPCILVTSADISEKEVLEAGAAGFMKKPKNRTEMRTFAGILGTKAIIAAAKKTNHYHDEHSSDKVDGIFAAGEELKSKGRVEPLLPTKDEINAASAKGHDGYVIALGASTGGTDALECVIKSFAATMPPIVVVQHMPPVFTKMYAERLDRSCAVHVKEAVDGDRLENGVCVIGAGGNHLELKKDAAGYYVSSKPGEKVSGHCPSVDVLFTSVAETAGKKAIAALMTGMGADGAKGLLKMHKKGAYTIGQDEESCVVYGMPMEAYKLGACAEQQPLNKIGVTICRRLAVGWTDKDINNK